MLLSASQRRVTEWPLFLTLLSCAQIAELSFLQMPFNLGSVHLIPVLCAYIALTRKWRHIAWLSLLLAIVGASSVGYSGLVYFAVLLWTALLTKIVVGALALEGRTSFTLLVMGAHIFAKLLVWILLKHGGSALPFPRALLGIFATLFPAGLAAYLLFPLFVKWDEYFEHEADDARELNPNVLK